MAAEKIRESVIAGTWYPADPALLKQHISMYLDRANPSMIEGDLTGLVVPHAGYIYSGGVAAHAYRLLLQNPYDRVLILAPSHQASFSGSSIYHLGGYRTPLGVVPLDRELIEDLYKYSDIVSYVPHADAREHSIEIQLPFLQTIFHQFSLTPVVMGDHRYSYCEKLSDAVAETCSHRRVLIIASSDLSHYCPYEEAKRLDETFVDRLNAFDPQGLAREIRAQNCQACGAGPILTLMLAAKKLGADWSKVLHYTNSGDVTGDKSSGVVGYAAAALGRGAATPMAEVANTKRSAIGLGYTHEEKEQLRELALHAIRSRCTGEVMPDLRIDSPRLEEPRGAFVCLHKGSELRGCIGTVEPRYPLAETIKKMAVEAAFGDPRFCSLATEELDAIDIEISVLTPLKRITDPGEIEIGKHGLLIRKGYRSGLLLPQVATEHSWDRTQFLQWTCTKAGLPRNAWQSPDIEIYAFSADVF
jgi:AmmeMemoRadiSam system protein B/AmmeMemoRadiSam system protein A